MRRGEKGATVQDAAAAKAGTEGNVGPGGDKHGTRPCLSAWRDRWPRGSGAPWIPRTAQGPEVPVHGGSAGPSPSRAAVSGRPPYAGTTAGDRRHRSSGDGGGRHGGARRVRRRAMSRPPGAEEGAAMPDAVVIGAGPNGLVAANLLADDGWAVEVVEAQPEPGGAVRSDRGACSGR
ncbi:NAD(P)-binding protein [Streptomyces sp. BBFR2]|uniref:NAD(P)-binding protein n=1 Tax=Streptomyces sp. BBFR2 TaxID=3372854 RepID=UPI0037DA424B